MPYCNVVKERSSEDDGVGTKIFYRRYGRGDTKVLLIIGNHYQKFFFSLTLIAIARIGGSESGILCDGVMWIRGFLF